MRVLLIVSLIIYQVETFISLNAEFLAELPSPPARRKRRLALGEWVRGHLDLWAYELRRPVKVIKDHRDGYSECHNFVQRLLGEIDSFSVSTLDAIVEEYVKEHRGKTPPR